MTHPPNHISHFTTILAFDPGATTGFAALDYDGKVLLTLALSLDELEAFLPYLETQHNVDVVVEEGPKFGHHSPITRRAEGLILEVWPDAHRVTPSQWKNRPALRNRLKLQDKVTVHEQDAARLGKWLYAMIGEKHEERPADDNRGSTQSD